VDRDRQSGDRLAADLLTVQPPPSPPSRSSRCGQPEQSRVTPNLTDDVVPEPQRGADQRAAHVPGIEQQIQRAKAIAHRPQQPLGDREFAGIAHAAAQVADDRHGAWPIAAGNHRRQRDEGLAQQERRAVGLGRVVEAHRGAGRLGRGARRQRVVDDGKAPPGDLAPDDPAQRRDQAEQPEPAVLDHPVVGLPAKPWRQRQEGLRDMAATGQQGADNQFGDGGPRRLRNRQHDLPEPSGKACREVGLMVRFHGVCERLVSLPRHDMGLVPPATPYS
jgi:hypothetical protein